MNDEIEKKKKDFKGVFYCIKENGEVTDEGIVDSMLDESISNELIRLGICRDMRIRPPEK